MANAKKCDCCGAFYELYNTKKNRYEINSFVPRNLDVDNRYWEHIIVELCPECMKPIHDILDRVKEREGGK